MRRRSTGSTSIASPSSPNVDPPANPRLRQTLARRIGELLGILLALVLRNVLGSALGRPRQTPDRGDMSGSIGGDHHPLCTGDLDRIPTDVFLQILKLLGPKEAARSSLVCKSWRVLVSDNKLWIFFLQHGKEPFDSILFAETHLRSGPIMYFEHLQQASFMSIYSRRAIVPGSIIIDGEIGWVFAREDPFFFIWQTSTQYISFEVLNEAGSGYCKFGWSKYAAPSGRCATFLEFGNLESPMHARLRHFFSAVYNRMQVRPSSYPITVSLPICHSEAALARKQLTDAIYSVLFDMNAPAVCAIDQAVLALYAARRTSGIVINIGFNVTSVVPILRGKVVHEVGTEVLGFGAVKLTGFLKELLQQRNINFQSLYTVRAIKEKLCYVAIDYDAELRKDTKKSCEVGSEGLFTLSKERFLTGEVLFQPHIGGLNSKGLHQAVVQCMDRCLSAEVASDGWFKTVVLSGGTSCLPGLPERLHKEIHKLLPPLLSEGIKVIPPPYSTDSAWFGAKIISNVSTFREAWCITKDQFQQKTRRNTVW